MKKVEERVETLESGRSHGEQAEDFIALEQYRNERLEGMFDEDEIEFEGEVRVPTDL